MSSRTDLCGLAPGQHSFEESPLQRQAVGDTASDLTGPGIEPQTSCTNSMRLTTELTGRFTQNKAKFISQQQ